MKIPKYWRKHEADVVRPDGSEWHLSAWGWSDTNAWEAETGARERFRSLERRLAQGLDLPHGYAYGTRPLREQILDEIPGADGEPAAMVTRNSYGSIVLNAARAMFVDVDVPLAGFSLKRLFGLGGRVEQEQARRTLDRVRDVLSRSQATFRVYRTAGGFRLLAVDRAFAPASADSESVMRAAGADPAFIQLCRLQESFRARLTPKPYRVGQTTPPGQFPRDDPEVQAAFADWLEHYERAIETRSTCRYVETIGNGMVHREIAPLLRLHDETTKAGSDLPLA